MDGWETRRRRDAGIRLVRGPARDPGVVRSVVVDTTLFRGNYPDRASLLGTVVDQGDEPRGRRVGGAPARVEARGRHGEPLRRDHAAADHAPPAQHLPRRRRRAAAGARGAAHRPPATDGTRTGASSSRGQARGRRRAGRERHVLLPPAQPHQAPGDSHGMHDGWETRRRRGPGHDWGRRPARRRGRDRPRRDRHTHFKGNYPDTCSLDARVSPDDADLEDGWSEVLPASKLGPHDRFVFPIDPPVAATHLRLNIHPDGGVARLARPRARDRRRLAAHSAFAG